MGKENLERIRMVQDIKRVINLQAVWRRKDSISTETVKRAIRLQSGSRETKIDKDT